MTGMKILIIENDSKISQIENDYLEMAGFNIVIEPDGSKALNMAIRDEIDLVITETNVLSGDGYSICSEIKKVKKIPVIFVSERTSESDIVRAFSNGADDYITKPFKPGELVARVKAHLNVYATLLGKSSKNELITVRGITLDKTARRVFLNGKEKIFTTKEYDLLEFLILHPNKAYSKEDLFRRIWNTESVGDNPTVTVHIKKIREKLGDKTGKNRYIDTVWGVGYRFVN